MMARGRFELIGWVMRNYRITSLVVVLMMALGVVGLVKMPKQEFPDFVIREGVVIAIYPGATAEEIEEQVARPLEEFLMTYKEVKRSKTVSTSQNGMCIVKVELNDYVNNKDEVWSKIKHGLTQFKMQLPSGVLAVVAQDDFGDTSALLIAVESDSRSYSELKTYVDELSARLRRLPSVTNIKVYGEQQEQITLYLDRDKLSAYGIGDKVLTASLFSQGLTLSGGHVENGQIDAPIHIVSPLTSEEEIANRIIFTGPRGDMVRVKDIARVVREYPTPDSYISYNGHRCLIVSTEMLSGNNIVAYGKEVGTILDDFTTNYLPTDVTVSRIADQAKVVGESVNDFLINLAEAIVVIIVVMMILFPFRSALVAAVTIPVNTFISVGLMYLFGIPLNIVTLAALIVVLGMIVDNSIVVIDGYLEFLGRGHSRWYSAIESAKKYFMSMLLGTVCVCVIFFPILFTMKGVWGDFVRYFPWTITINLMVSLLIAVFIVPILEFALIHRRTAKPSDKPTIVDRVQALYMKVLNWTFRHPRLTIGLGALSVVLAVVIATQLKMRMMPVAERDQFVVEIDLPAGTPLERTTQVADSMRRKLQQDERVQSVTAFVGCSAPRFQSSYAPRMAGKNNAQLIVNTRSVEATEEILDACTDSMAYAFPDAYVKYKQLDYNNVPTFEFRFIGDDFTAAKAAAEQLAARMRSMPGLVNVHLDSEQPQPIVDIRLDPVTASQLGVTKAIAAANLSPATDAVTIADVWEGDRQIPTVMKNDTREGRQSVQSLGDLYLSTVGGRSVPLRQIASVVPSWSESKIVRRNGVRTVTVTADMKRGVMSEQIMAKIERIAKEEIVSKLPAGLRFEVGGEAENDAEILPPIATGIGISLVIIFFFILFSFKKFGITIVSMVSTTLCLFGAMLGLWISGVPVGVTSMFGFISLLGMIMKNVILMYQHAEDERHLAHRSARDAAYDAGARRMTPIFLTTATTAVGVIPMIIEGSSFWSPVGVSIFAGGIGALIAVVTVLPVLYWKLYGKEDQKRQMRGAVAPPETHTA